MTSKQITIGVGVNFNTGEPIIQILDSDGQPKTKLTKKEELIRDEYKKKAIEINNRN
jgi:Ethanolamine utilization protein EutJ (predicted chaperonin)